jgi:predicted metal-dependent phosphoesterase TrpH
MLNWFKADLHVHTALSPCAEAEMTPRAIVAQALALGIRLLAVTDHQTAANTAACRAAALGTGLTVIPGIEVQTSEDVHLVCLLPDERQMADFSARIESALPPSLTGRERSVASVSLTADEVCREAAHRQGLVIAAHVERPFFSLFANLGFIPAKMQIAALEISSATDPAAFYRRHPDATARPLVVSSDAHFLASLNKAKYSYFYLAEPVTLREIDKALRGEDGRKIKIDY